MKNSPSFSVLKSLSKKNEKKNVLKKNETSALKKALANLTKKYDRHYLL